MSIEGMRIFIEELNFKNKSLKDKCEKFNDIVTVFYGSFQEIVISILIKFNQLLIVGKNTKRHNPIGEEEDLKEIDLLVNKYKH